MRRFVVTRLCPRPRPSTMDALWLLALANAGPLPVATKRFSHASSLGFCVSAARSSILIML